MGANGATEQMAITSAAGAGARSMVWHLEAGGWTQREAGNLVALVHGLKPVPAGWTVREIEHLRFLHALVRTGRIVR
jgi:hypothetical protein